MARTAVVRTLEEHPNLPEILGVLAQLAHIRDDELPRLAAAWGNPTVVAEARDAALRPDSPLVVEVLAAFDALSALFADDLRGSADYVTVDPQTTVTALKAVRDAIAAAYAKPVLTRSQHAALLRPWRSVYPQPLYDEPDLGPAADQVRAVLSSLPMLAARCHDPRGRELFDELVHAAWTTEADVREEARSSAWNAAVLTSRRRVWALVRRSATEGLGRACATCDRLGDDRDEQRVLDLCLDAVCALVVADALPDATAAVLTSPLSALIPRQRGA